MPLLTKRADALRFLHSDGPEVPVLLLPAIGTIPGVTISGAGFRNRPGKGFIRSRENGNFLSWKAPGSLAYGGDVDCSAGGNFLLEDGEDPGKFVRVNVQTAFLSATGVEESVYLRDRRQNIFDDITAGLAQSGKTTVKPVIVKNVGNSAISNLVVWVAGKDITISVGGPFSAPPNEASALSIGSLTVGATATVDIKQVIPPATAAEARRVVALSFRFDAA